MKKLCLILNYLRLILSMLIAILLISLQACKDDEVKPEGITDIDGNVYTSVEIGTQTWMVENLKVTKYRNGNPIPTLDKDALTWGDLTTGAYSNFYDNSLTNGRLYNWYAVNDSRGLAPKGWHIPTEAEWTILFEFLGGENVAGSKLKEKGTTHWCDPNDDATNETGFTALPGDWRLDIGFGIGCGDSAFWSADEKDVDQAYNLFLFNGTGEVSRVYNDKYVGWGVRCIKD